MENCWSYRISQTVQSSISSEKSAETAMLLQMTEDCSRWTCQKHYAFCL